MRKRSRSLFCLLVAVPLALACGGDAALRPSAPDVTQAKSPSGGPHFLSVDSTAPSLASLSVSFYAVKGQGREALLWYSRDPARADSSKLARFRVDRRSLCNRPNGTPIANGDSILITMTVTDPTTQLVEFQPSGLLFCSGRPANLQMWYEETDHDFNHDGVVNNSDLAIERNLAIWKRETPSSPWFALRSIVTSGADEVEADITGFTGYLVAY